MRRRQVGQIQRPGQRPESVVFFEEDPEPLIQTFTDEDATPSVLGHDLWQTGNSTATSITDFDDGRVAQRITVIFKDANTTVDFTSSGLKGNSGVNWSPGDGDHMTCVYDGADWYCDVSDNTA